MPSHHSSHHSSSHSHSTHHTPIHHTTHHTPMHHMHNSSTPFDPSNPGAGIVRRSSSRGCMFAVILFIVIIFGSVGAVFYGVMKTANAVTSAFSSSASSSTSSTSSVQATITADIAQMTNALSPRLPTWKGQTDGKTTVYHVSASDAGFKANENTKEVIYGRCADNTFYTYVLEQSKPEDTIADTEGYAYIPGGKPDTCLPSGFKVIETEKVNSNWTFVTLTTTQATATP